MVPVRTFVARFREFRFARSPKVSGILLSKLFRLKSRAWRKVRLPNDAGI
jgi:hypothetical protein